MPDQREANIPLSQHYGSGSEETFFSVSSPLNGPTGRQQALSTASGGGSSSSVGAAKLSAKEQAAAEEAKAKLERMVKVGHRIFLSL